MLLGRPLTRQEFERAPDTEAWTTELAHQVTDPGEPEAALAVVRESLSGLYGW